MNASWSLELGSCWCLVNELGAGWAYLDSRSNRAAEKVHLPLKQMETEGSLLRFPPGPRLITSRAKELLGRVLRWYCLRTCWKARWLTVGAVISCAPSLMRMWGSRRRRSNGCCKAHLSNLSWFLLYQGGHLCKSVASFSNMLTLCLLGSFVLSLFYEHPFQPSLWTCSPCPLILDSLIKYWILSHHS